MKLKCFSKQFQTQIAQVQFIDAVSYCAIKEKELSSTYAKRTNQCGDFMLNPIDAYGENLNGYQPRKPKRKYGEQIRMEDL